MKCIALNRCHKDNARTEYTTRKWKLSKNWHQERVAFDCFQMLGYLTIYTDRCNKRKLCASILTLVKLKTSTVLHGLLYEAVARQTCMYVRKCFFVVYSFLDIFVKEINVDRYYGYGCMLPN